MLWGDWIKVSDYDFVTDHDADELKPPFKQAEEQAVHDLLDGMVAVRVRGVDGYMYPQDLSKERLLEVVFVDVGQGDGALLVTPDDRKYVIDAGEGDNMYRYLRWRFRNFEKAHTDFDGLIITHPDKDHYAGFERLVEDSAVVASNIWHNGLIEQFGIKPNGRQDTGTAVRLGERVDDGGQHYLTDLMIDDAKLGNFLADKDRWVKRSTGRPKEFPDLLNTAREAKDQAGTRRFGDIAMLSTAHGEIADGKSYLSGHAPGNQSGCEIEIVGPVVEPDNAGKPRLRTFSSKPQEKTAGMNVGKTKNGHSVLLRLEYRKLTLLLGGDLNSPAEMFLLSHATGRNAIDADEDAQKEIVEEASAVFGADVAKACHHGSADFTDLFLNVVKPAATVISSGDEESHAHPRCDTLGAIGLRGHGWRPLIFSTELARSTREFTNRDDTPWFKAAKLEGEADKTDDPDKKAELLRQARILWEDEAETNVTVYGSINLRSNGERVVLAYMLEKPSVSNRWDVYPLEPDGDGKLAYLPVKEAVKAEKKRREAAAG